VVVGGRLLDGTGGVPLEDAVVAIRDGRIAAVGWAGEVAFAPDAPVYDARGKTILPGFVNAHVHTNELATDELKGWTRAGVTTIRDLGGPRELMLTRGAQVHASSDLTLPRLLVAGPIITVPGGHPIPVYGLSDEVLTVDGPDDARAKVRALIDAGANVVKIAVSGRTDVRWPELSNHEIQAIAEVARERGAHVAAHIDRAAALRRAVENGISDAAHMPRDRMPDDLIAQMVGRGVALIPTIDVYEALAEERGAGDEWRRTTQPVMYDNLRRFVGAGGTLALGDDYGNPGVTLGMPMAEIRHWLAAGLDPMQVIVAATRGSAEVCGLAGEIGTVEVGKAADLLVVDGDPLVEIDALERAALVIRAGEIIRD
jgi:imidazolonepropionase-like amidohydrolase